MMPQDSGDACNREKIGDQSVKAGSDGFAIIRPSNLKSSAERSCLCEPNWAMHKDFLSPGDFPATAGLKEGWRPPRLNVRTSSRSIRCGD